MTPLKMVTQLATLLLTLALSNVLFAGESVKNAHKDNGTGNTVSNADATGHVDGDIPSASIAKATAKSQQKITNNILPFRQMEKRHRQMREAQLEAYKRYLEERKQRSASYNQAQREAYIKLKEERRALINKMMDEHRQAAEKRRKSMLLKMHQTSTTPASSIAEQANRA